MNDKIKVSVIVPIYNSEKHLTKCLNSLIKQTLKEIEIICINNGSDDNSLSILKRFSKKDHRLRIINIPKSNAGVARNKGISLSLGEYLSFVDSDDFCLPNMLEKSYNTAKKNKSDIVIFEYNTFDNKTHTITYCPLKFNFQGSEVTFSPDIMKDSIFSAFRNCPWNKLFRKEFVINNSLSFQEIPRSNDIFFTFMSLVLAETITAIQCPLINYRINTETSLQSTNELSPLSSWDACRKVKASLLTNGLYDLYEQSFLNETLEITLYNLDRMPKNSTPYNYLFNTIRYGSEIEFGFSQHEKNYYRDKNYFKYLEIINTPSTEERIKEVISEITSAKSHRIGVAITKIPRQVKKLFKI